MFHSVLLATSYLSDFIVCKFMFSGIFIPQLWWGGILESALYTLVKLSIYDFNFLSYFFILFNFFIKIFDPMFDNLRAEWTDIKNGHVEENKVFKN